MNAAYKKGRGAQLNVANPYHQNELVKEHLEGIDDYDDASRNTEIFYEHPKKIVSKNDSPDLRLPFSVNPYQGCEHGCVYCYARNAHQYWGFSAGLDFESKIIVKPEAPQLLEKQFLEKSWKPSTIMLSGNTDCYQPLERKLKITRQLLEVFLKYRNPVGIVTKNNLIERDVDLLKELAKDRLVHVILSITTLDEHLRQKMEPRAASGLKRVQAVSTLSEAGVPVGVLTAPIIPGLNNTEIPELVKAVCEAGAQFVGYTVVRLNGSVGELFHDWLKKNFPERAQKVWNQISSLHGGKVNDSEWGRRLKGEGNIADMIKGMFDASKKKYMKGDNALPPLNLDAFRRGGNYQLF